MLGPVQFVGLAQHLRPAARQPFFDKGLEVIHVPVAADGDSGPHLNAGIGIHNGEIRFIADETGEYVIEVDGFLGLGFGWYMVVMGTRTPLPVPLHWPLRRIEQQRACWNWRYGPALPSSATILSKSNL